MKVCWHRWDVYYTVRQSDGYGVDNIVKRKKVCRKCGAVRIKERIY